MRSHVSNPWTIAPIVAASWAIGRLIVSSPPIELTQVSLSALVTAAFWQSLAAQWRQLLPFAVGSLILAMASAVVAYPLMVYFLRYRRKHHRPEP